MRDVRTGKRLAKQFMPTLRYYGGQAALAWIVLDMIKAEGDHAGLIVGFMSEIACCSSIGGGFS
jgi:hypothetical protein